MSVRYYPDTGIFKLDSSASTMILSVYQEGYLLMPYYGALLPDEDFATSNPFADFEKRSPSASFSPADPVIGEHGFSPDSAPMAFSGNGSGDFRISAVSVQNATGDSVADFRYVSHSISAGKPVLPALPSSLASEEEAETLSIHLRDGVTGMELTLYYTVFSSLPVIATHASLKNGGKDACVVKRLASFAADFPSMDYDLITLYGRHARERYEERRPLSHGLQGVESRRGVTGHSQNSFVALVSKGANEEQGEAYGFHLVYSGNFSALVECDSNATSRIVTGISPEDFAWRLESDESFTSPEALAIYSGNGIGEMSRICHRFINRHIIRGPWKDAKRPLLINSWEAALFDFDEDKLVAFAHEAKKLGIELLVMDDGWFGKRNDDTSSLGDWFCNTGKLPLGLKHLSDRVHAEGLKFGIWFEPEMISPDSDLFRAHPDWHVHVSGRDAKLGRNQYVLDVSREDVRENIWEQMHKILSEVGIDYVKWDFNRNIADAGSAALAKEHAGEFFYRFILGTYDLMNRMVTEFPDILFENCSGGGGRFDPAMLCYSPQIWTSDNTDPLERLPIQFGTSLGYPASTMGAHISACNRTGFTTRGNVALWGSFGYELDPRKLTEGEIQEALALNRLYNETYSLIHQGDLYRLISPFENSYRAAWEFVSPDKKEAMLTLVTVRREIYEHVILKLRGLDPGTVYTEVSSGKQYSGAFLMQAGLVLSGKAATEGESLCLRFIAK